MCRRRSVAAPDCKCRAPDAKGHNAAAATACAAAPCGWLPFANAAHGVGVCGGVSHTATLTHSHTDTRARLFIEHKRSASAALQRRRRRCSRRASADSGFAVRVLLLRRRQQRRRRIRGVCGSSRRQCAATLAAASGAFHVATSRGCAARITQQTSQHRATPRSRAPKQGCLDQLPPVGTRWLLTSHSRRSRPKQWRTAVTPAFLQFTLIKALLLQLCTSEACPTGLHCQGTPGRRRH